MGHAGELVPRPSKQAGLRHRITVLLTKVVTNIEGFAFNPGIVVHAAGPSRRVPDRVVLAQRRSDEGEQYQTCYKYSHAEHGTAGRQFRWAITNVEAGLAVGSEIGERLRVMSIVI
jgi:hypothetical protein